MTRAVAQAPDLGVARRRSGLEPVLLFGGTFDPVHLAHLAMAREALACMGASRLVLVPAGDPPHRPPPGADARHRTRMLALACAGDPRMQIDNREIHREGPSYSVLTLSEYRAELGSQVPLIMVLGADAAAGLGQWRRASELAGLAHLLVLARAETVLDEALPVRLGWQPAVDARALRSAPAGRWLRHTGPLMPHSATAVREALARGEATAARWLDPAVRDYIAQHRLYRRG